MRTFNVQLDSSQASSQPFIVAHKHRLAFSSLTNFSIFNGDVATWTLLNYLKGFALKAHFPRFFLCSYQRSISAFCCLCLINSVSVHSKLKKVTCMQLMPLKR